MEEGFDDSIDEAMSDEQNFPQFDDEPDTESDTEMFDQGDFLAPDVEKENENEKLGSSIQDSPGGTRYWIPIVEKVRLFCFLVDGGAVGNGVVGCKMLGDILWFFYKIHDMYFFQAYVFWTRL